MKILQITDGIPPLSLGGAASVAWELSTALARKGHAVTVLTSAGAGTLPSSRDGVAIETLQPLPTRWAHYRSVFGRKRAEEVLAVIRRVQPDVIHAHVTAWQSGYRWIAGAHALGIPVFFTAHDVMTAACGRVLGFEKIVWWHDLRRSRWTWNPLRTAMTRKFLKLCKEVITVSDAQRTFLERHRVPVTRTVHNGIDVDFWKATMTQAEARKTLGLPSDAPLFLLAGRVGVDKGTAVTVAALPSNAHLIVAGEADPRDFAALGDRYHYFKRQTPEQMRAVYAACDAAIVPSLCLDCFPTVCLEAMASSRPVIATSWGGAKESVVDGQTGWIIDPRDTRAWGERMQWCAEHRKELPAFGAHGRTHIEKNFALGRFVENVTRLYQE